MKLSFHIARRYLFSKKSHNVINVISGISVGAIAFATMAMVVVLSAFNGIEGLVDDLYSSFDADIEVRAQKGKVFHEDSLDIDKIEGLEGVEAVSRSIEENALVEYEGEHMVVTIKGVEEPFLRFSGLDSMVPVGDPVLKGKEGEERVILGLGIRKQLGVPVNPGFPSSVRFSVPDRKKELHRHREQAFKHLHAPVSGVFSVNVDFDSRYALSSLDFASELFDHEEEWSALVVDVKERKELQKVKEEVERIAGPSFQTRTRYEKNRLLYKTNRTEKWITFLILSFIMVIATFNIIASLTMLILEKKEDIRILQGMGASKELIRRIFFTEGLLINLSGGLLGIGIGVLLCLAQSQWGLVSLHNAVVDYYPIDLHFIDLLSILGVVLLIGLISASFPVRLLTRKYLGTR